MIIEHRQSYAAASSPYTIDLRTIGDNMALPTQAGNNAGLTQSLADFDIEVIDNAATVTMTGTGSFANSDPVSFTDGTFAIAGQKRKIEGFSLASLTFTSASTPFNINIVRRIEM